MEVDEQEVVGNEEEQKEDHGSAQDNEGKPFLADYNTLEDYSKALLSGMCYKYASTLMWMNEWYWGDV